MATTKHTTEIMEEEVALKLDDSNSKVVKGLRIATVPDESGMYSAEILPEAVPVIPKDEKEREKLFDQKLDELMTLVSLIPEQLKKNPISKTPAPKP